MDKKSFYQQSLVLNEDAKQLRTDTEVCLKGLFQKFMEMGYPADEIVTIMHIQLSIVALGKAFEAKIYEKLDSR